MGRLDELGIFVAKRSIDPMTCGFGAVNLGAAVSEFQAE
jgi:hypothetical protein